MTVNGRVYCPTYRGRTVEGDKELDTSDKDEDQ